MLREVEYKGTTIKYNLTRKRVKNINLRIKPDCSVEVSASSRVSLKYIDEFIIRKGDFILKAITDFKRKESVIHTPKFSNVEFEIYVYNSFNNTYNLFKSRGFNIDKPQLKFRKMKSRWGSCNYVKCVITLNTNLIYCTREQIDYVIIHEFSHLIVPNHSSDFYDVVKMFCPDYKRIRKEMKGINI